VEEPPQKVERTDALVAHGFTLARSLGVRRVLVQADELGDIRLIERVRESESLIWVTRQSALPPGGDPDTDIVIPIPDSALNRLSRVHLAFLLAVLNGWVDRSETVLCLSGIVGSGHLDTLFLSNPSQDLPWLKKLAPTGTASGQLGRLLTIAVRLAAEGREGKPVGTVFVHGDPTRLAPYLRQLVLNPCAGHPDEALDIANPEIFETLREFAAMDGAFVVDPGGIVRAAAVFLNAPIGNLPMRPGLGARHAAALAATRDTGAVAVVVSSSSGTITVFQEGRLILELEKP
jgi:hypothetical protein